jgi:hypothetical protein
MRRLALTLLLTFAVALPYVCSQTVDLKGRVTDAKGIAMEGVTIYVPEAKSGTTTDKSGSYSISLKSDKGKPIVIVFRFLGYEEKTVRILPALGKSQSLDIKMEEMAGMLDSTEVFGDKFKDSRVGETKLDPKNTQMLPSASGNAVTDLIKLLPGVTSNNELTSQYSVRGGNFDENLIYVNDFEIYRPLLVTNSLQEGLSFINPDLTQSISFNAGGFEAKYGDRMSSVLNIRYKRPTKFGGSAMASLLGASAHLEGVAGKDNRLMFLMGFRYKSNAYLLGSLDLTGEYDPRFLDLQTNIIYKTSKKTELELMLAHSDNTFNFVPESQSTTTGAFNQILRLSVFFEGNQSDFFRNTMGGLSFKIMPNERSIFKFINSAWKINESENFNLIGTYFLDEIEGNFDSDNFGQVRRNLGFGTFQDWARNRMEGYIYNTGMRNSHVLGSHILEWGASLQGEMFDDQLSEWQRIDSAGFAVPYGSANPTITNRLRSQTELNSYRLQAFVQDEWRLVTDKGLLTINAGARIHYWSINNQVVVSPRAQLYFKPKSKQDWSIKLAGGLYAQPPLYREIRDFDGNLNPEVRAQKALQVVAGSELNFKLGVRNFKFTSEAYYKHLTDIVPYQVQDVRVRYFAENNATGYATGVDLRLFGEFVKGTDSWVSISYLNTKEDIKDDFFIQYFNENGELISGLSFDQVAVDSNIVYPGYIRRPSDQRFNMSIFFQDYLVKNKNFKMHMQLQIGSGLPYGPPDRKRYNDVFRMPPYRRVDIGFSYLLVDGEKQVKSSFFNKFDKIWLSAEVLNLLGVQNTLSYRWVKDIQNVVWPLPNYLTSRRVNVRLYVKF